MTTTTTRRKSGRWGKAARGQATTPRRRISKAAQRLKAYRASPALWARHKLGIELARYRDRATLDAWLATQPPGAHAWARDRIDRDMLVLDGQRSYQAEALDMMATPGRYAMRWCNGAAKTTTAALLVLWFLDCYPGGRVITTAGTWSQLKEQLWREIAMWAGRAQLPIAASMAPEGIGKTQCDIAPDWAAFGRAADKGATFEGVHAPYVLAIMDEAKAIKQEIFDAVLRIMRGNPGASFWWVCLSSPGSPSGPFFDISVGDRAHRWTNLSLSAYESERVELDIVAADAADLGEDSPLFVAMDLGEFPDETQDTIIPLSIAQLAVDRPVRDLIPITLGIDVARMGGDETVFARCDGQRVSIVDSYTGRRATHTQGRVVQLRHGVDTIGIDEGGMGGPMLDNLLEMGVRVVGLNAGASSPDKRYFDLGTQMAFDLRRELERGAENPDREDIGVSLPNDKRLLHQLCTRKYVVRRNGQVKAEAKDDMKTRSERSPDRADAVQMAHWLRSHGTPLGSSLSDNVTSAARKRRRR